MPCVVILGAGTGGTLVANRLRRLHGDELEIVVVDRDDRHVYQPALLFVPFWMASPYEIVRPRSAQLHDGIDFRVAECERVDTADTAVHLADGTAHSKHPPSRRSRSWSPTDRSKASIRA